MKDLLSVKRAGRIIHGFPKARILVIGDLIMDHFIWGKVRRISPEAPVPVVEVSSESVMLGGSANVVNNITCLGGGAFITGVVGRDNDGRNLVKLLKARGIRTDGIITDAKRPTTIKTRVIAHNQQVVRFDRERRDQIDPRSTDKVLDYIKKTVKAADVVVISDYAKGLVTKRLVEETVVAASAHGALVAVDPKVEHFDYYRGVSIVTPNNLEASQASGVDITDAKSLHRAGEVLLNKLGCTALLVTRGEQGMSLFTGDSEAHVPTVAREVFDVSGAGDTVIAALSLALASGADYKEAAVIANFAAGVVVGKIGTATLDSAELMAAVAAGLSSTGRKANVKAGNK